MLLWKRFVAKEKANHRRQNKRKIFKEAKAAERLNEEALKNADLQLE